MRVTILAGIRKFFRNVCQGRAYNFCVGVFMEINKGTGKLPKKVNCKQDLKTMEVIEIVSKIWDLSW